MALRIKNPLVPAKAGTQAGFESCSGSHRHRMDSRLRGNERLVGGWF